MCLLDHNHDIAYNLLWKIHRQLSTEFYILEVSNLLQFFYLFFSADRDRDVPLATPGTTDFKPEHGDGVGLVERHQACR